MSETDQLLNLALEKLDYPIILRLMQARTICNASKEKVATWRPFKDYNQIALTQRKISALRELADQKNSPPLEDFEDLHPELNRCKIPGTFLYIDKVATLRNILKLTSKLKNYYKSNKAKLSPLENLFESLQPLPHISQKINSIIDEQNQVKDSASPELKRIRIAKFSTKAKLESTLQKIFSQAKRAGLLHEENPTIRNGHYVLPIKIEHKRKFPGIFHGQSATGATVYIEPLEIVEITNELTELEQAEKAEIERILIELTNFVRPEIPTILANIDIIVEIDSYNAAARFSKDFNCSAPVITEEQDRFEIINGRHPVLALHKEVVPLNFSVPKGKRLVLISGPNAGGKTVAMKTVGLLTLMALSGWHIPASPDSQIPFFNQILVDIGDEQSIENDLSTFSSHISNLNNFLKIANQQSLILIDELGTGTEPNEGAALAQAIITKFLQSGAFTVATTHHHSLKEFAEKHPAAINASMEFDQETLQPTYRLQMGIPGSSYAFEIAERLGLPKEVVTQGREILGKERYEVTTLLSKLNSLRKEAEEKLKTQMQTQSVLDNLIKEYQQKLEHLKKRELEQSSELIIAIEKFLNASRQTIENTIRTIKEQAANKESIRSAHQTLQNLNRDFDQLRNKIFSNIPQKQASPAVGDKVRIKNLPGIGTVISPVNKAGRCEVDIEGKKIFIPIDQLEIIPAQQATQTTSSLNSGKLIPDTSSLLRLDIRGLRVAEAEEVIEKFLDNAILAGVTQVEIIHGYGTGALQKLTHEILKKFPGVKNFYFQNFDSGGSGVTVVEL